MTGMKQGLVENTSWVLVGLCLSYGFSCCDKNIMTKATWGVEG